MRAVLSRVLLVCAAVAGAGAGVSAEEPFFDGSFDEACRLAKEKNKVVMIDFYTTWCGPCRMLDRYTWPDAKVKEWLKANTVPMKLDAERNRELAWRYKVRSYPTMVFLKPDGVEISRTVGFQQPTPFLMNAARIIAPQTPVAAAPAAARPGEVPPLNMLDRMKRGRELMAAGKNAEALSEWLWCFDHGEKEGPGLTRIRLSTVPTEIAGLGKSYPPALEELRKRRDVAEKTLLAAEGPNEPGATTNLTLTAKELASLNRALGDADRSIAVLEALSERGDLGRALQQAMFSDLLDLLLRSRRYQEIVLLAGDVFTIIDERIARCEENDKRESKLDQRARQNLALYLRQQVVADAGKLYEALLGAGRLNEADTLAERVLKFDSSPTAFVVLVEHAKRAKAFDSAKALIDRAQNTLTQGEASMVRKAGAGLPQS